MLRQRIRSFSWFSFVIPIALLAVGLLVASCVALSVGAWAVHRTPVRALAAAP